MRGKELQALANIGGPNVTIEDWMLGLEICGKECVNVLVTRDEVR